MFRGVTRHRWTGRYEAHLWDKNCWNESQNKKGRQVYLGAYGEEETAARAYDLAALKYWGQETPLNFPVSTYHKELEEMEGLSREEYIGSLRRKSSGFSRGVSKYRGVARHHHNGRWEARIGRVFGNKYLYLGTYATQEEAAVAYDMAAIEHRGLNAVTNFDISRYTRWPTTPDQQNSHQTHHQPCSNNVDDPTFTTSPDNIGDDGLGLAFFHHPYSPVVDGVTGDYHHHQHFATASAESDAGPCDLFQDTRMCFDSCEYDYGGDCDDIIIGELDSFMLSMFDFDAVV